MVVPGQAPSGLQGCVTADEYERNGHSYTLRSLAPGNYTIEVTPITVAGAGNVSAVHPPIFIPVIFLLSDFVRTQLKEYLIETLWYKYTKIYSATNNSSYVNDS